MNDAVINARSRIRRLAVAKTRFDRVGEALVSRCCWLKRLDDLHRAKHFAGIVADIGDAILAARRTGADRAAQNSIGPSTKGMPAGSAERQLGREMNRMTSAGDAHDEVAQRDRQGGADDLFDDRRIDGQPRGDLRRAIFFEEARRRDAAGCGAPRGECRRRSARRAS